MRFRIYHKPYLKGKKPTLNGVSVRVRANTSKLEANRSIQLAPTLVSAQQNAKGMLIRKSLR